MNILSSLVFVVLLVSTQLSEASTIDRIRARGRLKCGVMLNLGFATFNGQGALEGFDIDFCRAISTAIFNTPDRVEFQVLTFIERFDVLRSGQLDLIAGGNTFTLERDNRQGLDFPVVSYVDINTMMVKSHWGLTRTSQLNGASICVTQGTTAEAFLGLWSLQNRLAIESLAMEKSEDLYRAFMSDRCDAWFDSRVMFSGIRAVERDPNQFTILSDEMGREPTGPAVRKDDPTWSRFVRWVFYAWIRAEELGIQKSNVKWQRQHGSADARLFLNSEVDTNNDWIFKVIEATGNYGEVYERHLGAGPLGLKIPRDRNSLYNSGGQLLAPPFDRTTFQTQKIQSRTSSSPVSSTLARVRSRGRLRCGISDGPSSRFAREFCQAVTIAIFGSPQHLEEVAISATNDLLVASQQMDNGELDLIGSGVSASFYVENILRLEVPILLEFHAQPRLVGFGPAVSERDLQWVALIRWIGQALIAAEELEIKSTNIHELASSRDFRIRTFLRRPIYSKDMGLSPDWIVDVIRGKGNYGEIYSRLASADQLPFARGPNAQRSDGGLHMALPFR